MTNPMKWILITVLSAASAVWIGYNKYGHKYLPEPPGPLPKETKAKPAAPPAPSVPAAPGKPSLPPRSAEQQRVVDQARALLRMADTSLEEPAAAGNNPIPNNNSNKNPK
jgi:hypothetical protein